MSAAPLSATERKLYAMLQVARGGESLRAFIPRVSRADKFEVPEHLAPLLDALEQAQSAPVRCLVSTPPRHGKTASLLHAAVWHLLRHPNHTVGYLTYGAALALEGSWKARLIANRAGLKLSRDRKNLSDWHTAQGGGFLAAGIGGALTGRGLNLLLVDDPVKSRADAESSLIRNKTADWFADVAYTRLEPGGSCLVIATRWHADDLIGRLGKQDDPRWQVINLPALSDDGVALWPARYPVEELEKIHRQVGAYTWASLYQGRPVPKGGQVFSEPARYRHPDVDGARIVIGCDPAASEKTHADYSACVVLAVKGHSADTRADVLEVMRIQAEVPRLVQELRKLQLRWQAPIAIEAVSGFKAVPQMLRSIDPKLRVFEVQPRGDKFLRCQSLAAAWKDQRVRVPMSAPWLPDFLDEMLSFTGIRDAHDDQCDAAAHAWNAAFRAVGVLERGAVAAPLLAFA